MNMHIHFLLVKTWSRVELATCCFMCFGCRSLYSRMYAHSQERSPLPFTSTLPAGVQINAAQWCWSGFIAGFEALDTGNFPGIIYMVGGAGWSVLALFTMWVMKDSWFFFRGQGGVKEVQDKEKQDAALAAFKHQQQAGASFARI